MSRAADPGGRDIEVAALIVGAGPVGLLAAHLLGRAGVETLVVEKHAERLAAPKAHALNPRSLEICAAAGLPMEAILSKATPEREGGSVCFASRLVDAPFGVLPYERQGAAAREITPWPLINIAQPDFEAVIEPVALGHASVRMRRRVEWLRFDRVGEGAVSTLRDLDTGGAFRVRSRYLIGADGAGSAVREDMGVGLSGLEGLQTMMMIHFRADLRAHVADRPAILYFLFGAEPGATFIAYDIASNWVLMHPCAPGETPDDYDPARCRALIEAGIGAPAPDLDVLGVRAWTMNAQVALRYRSGPAVLVGDAAHRFPPTGGLGLNTGLADADNLCWRLIAVERGWAHRDCLDDYQRERRPVAQVNMGHSLANAFRMRAVSAALGADGAGRLSPDALRARLLDPAARAAVEAAVQAQAPHFDSIRLQIGYGYAGAPADDDSAPINVFTPRAAPGGRLPHVPLADGRSTLDLVAPEALTLVLLAGAAAPRSAAASVPIVLRREGPDFALRAGRLAAHPAFALPEGSALLLRPDGHILAILEGPRADVLAEAAALAEAALGRAEARAPARAA